MGDGELDDVQVFNVLSKYFDSISKPNLDNFIESIFCAMMHERKRLVNFRVAEVMKPIDCIIIPVNVGQHWTLAWINFQDRSINYSDRMDYNMHENLQTHHQNKHRWLRQIADFFQLLMPGYGINNFRKKFYGKDLQHGGCKIIDTDELQEDIVSCGDIMLAQMLDLVRHGNVRRFKADQTKKFRVEMASYMLKKASLIKVVDSST